MAAAPVDIKAYVFTHDEEERRRLDGQHLIVQRAFGRDRIVLDKRDTIVLDKRGYPHPHPLTLHPLIEPAALRAVLDVGAGTCAWITDVARLVHGVGVGMEGKIQKNMGMPGAFPVDGAGEATDNTSTANAPSLGLTSSGANSTAGEAAHQVLATTTASTPPPPALFACDITAAKFPPQATLQKLGIRAFEHDIRKELPGGMAGLFSLISIRLVLVWLTVDEIKVALRNVRNVLAPGGRIHLTEAQMYAFYAPEEAQHEFIYDHTQPDGDKQSPPLNKHSYLYPLNVAIQEGRRRAGLVVDTDRQLPPLLAEAGLRVVAEGRGTVPVGRMVGAMLGGGAEGIDANARTEGADANARAEEGEAGERLDGGVGERLHELAVPRPHVPYSVKSFGPPSPSAVKTGFDFGEKDASFRAVDTATTHPHIRPPLPLSPALSATDLNTITTATSKMFGHFAGMMREAWAGGYLPSFEGGMVETEDELKAIEARVWREFEAKGCHYGVREWVLEVV